MKILKHKTKFCGTDWPGHRNSSCLLCVGLRPGLATGKQPFRLAAEFLWPPI